MNRISSKINNFIDTKISKNLFFAALFIISFIFYDLAVSTILFIFNIGITKFNIFIALFLSIISILFLLKEKNTENIFLSIVIPIVLIAISPFISTIHYDISYDGNTYHKMTIGFLSDGWNPIYEKAEHFDANSKIQMNIKQTENYIWANHYAKASYIFGASIVKVTNNIETSKCINFLSIIAFIFFVLSFKTRFSTLLLIASVITLPTIGTQLFTNYIDGLVYIYFFLIIYLFFAFDKCQLFETKKELLITYFMILVIAINIKFSLFAFAGIYCLGYYIWYLIRLKKGSIDKKFLKQMTLTSIFAVLFAVFVVGLCVYPKNMLENKNPFYPLYGKNKIDIMTRNSPVYFRGKSPVEKYVISMFSRVSNKYSQNDQIIEYKIPFTFNDEEIDYLSLCDLRMSGNGIIYSGIFVISLLLLPFLLIKTFRKDKRIFMLMIIPFIIMIIMIFTMKDIWWARYFPQTHLIFIFDIILLIFNNKLVYRIIFYILFILLMINNIISISKISKYNADYDNIIKSELTYLKESDLSECDFKIYTNESLGIFYNIRDIIADQKVTFVNRSTIMNETNTAHPLFYNKMYWYCLSGEK